MRRRSRRTAAGASGRRRRRTWCPTTRTATPTSLSGDPSDGREGRSCSRAKGHRNCFLRPRSRVFSPSMGIEWRLCLVDHEHVVERGLRLLDDVRTHLLSKPWESDADVVRMLEERLKVLAGLNSPEMLLDHARRALAEARGDHVTPAEIRELDFRTARRLLRGWNMSQRVYPQGSMFDLIHWTVDARRRERAEEAVLQIGEAKVIEPHWRLYPGLEPTVWDHAYYGSAETPVDFDGIPIGGGSLFGSYNPPTVAAAIADEIARTRLPGWPEILQEFARTHSWNAGKLQEEQVEKDVRAGWEQTVRAYETAAKRGFGVLIEASD